MTVTPEQIEKAKAHGLTNVEHLAAAADKHDMRFYLCCTILQKETGGKNIYGHDKGGTFTIFGNKDVTEENFREFWAQVAPKPEGLGKTSNGVGPLQITYKGFLADMLARGLKPWDPADNIDYGVEQLAKTYRAQRKKGRSVTQAFQTAANVYNLGRDSDTWHYGIAAVKLAATWKQRVGTDDLGTEPTPEPVPSDVGDWVVDPQKVTTNLRGRDKDGKIVANLPPGTVITDGVRFEFNAVGRVALWTEAGISYDREYLTQVAAGPVPEPPIPEPGVEPSRPFPVIPDYAAKTEKLKFRGGLTCICVATSLPWVEYRMLEAGVIRFNIDIYQLGYRGDVDASRGTHAEGGNTDVGQYSPQALDIWREMGWAMQDRSPFFEDDHGHGWPVGCPHLSPAAEKQETSWNNGRNGLKSNGRITGPDPKGKATPRWDDALAKYKQQLTVKEIS